MTDQFILNLCAGTAATVLGKLFGDGWETLKGNNSETVLLGVYRDWQSQVATEAGTLAKAFQLFFCSEVTIGELDKVLRDQYVDVDFDVLDEELGVVCDSCGCPGAQVDLVQGMEILVRDLDDWLRATPAYRKDYQISLQHTLQALQGPEAAIGNHSLARRKYLEAVRLEHGYVRFLGTAETGGPTEVPIRQVYVAPQLTFRPDGLSEESARRDQRSGAPALREPKRFRAHLMLTAKNGPRRAVVLGAPGSGKSTLGQWVALSLAEGKLKGAQRAWDLPKLVPVFYRLRHLAEDLSEASKTAKAPTLWDCLHRRLSQLVGLTLPGGFLRRMDQRHGLLVFFDGLDEAADQGHAVQLISGFARSIADNSRALVTSRPLEYRHPFAAALFRHFELCEFGGREIRSFINKWREARGADQAEAKQQADNLWTSLKRRPDIQPLARNALLLTMIVRVHFWQGKLPNSRVELYEKCADTLLEHWEVAAGLPRGPLDREEKRLFLSQLAFEMQRDQPEGLTKEGALQISESELRRHLRRFLREQKPGVSAGEVIRRLQARDAILVDYGKGQFGFIHRSFQEYFAACWLREEMAQDLTQFEDRDGWRETLVMAVAQLAGREKRQHIVELIQRNQLPIATECVKAGKKVERWLDVLTRYLSKYYGRDPEFLRISAQECAEACGERGETAEVLTALFEPENRDGRSLAAAVELAEKLRGSMPEATQLLDGFFAEAGKCGLASTAKMAAVDGILIDQFLVTNEDFERMLPGHAKLRGQYSSEDRQPVIYVNWWEANLYCRWRGPEFRLPTEDEWYKAASWDPETRKNREYPWGDDWEEERCNTSESGLRKTTPVDKYPDGVSPYGCYDMAGNVWEWTTSEVEEYLVIRGGSWRLPPAQRGLLGQEQRTPGQP